MSNFFFLNIYFAFKCFTDYDSFMFAGGRWVLCSIIAWFIISSVQFSHSVLFDSLRPHGLQHARLPCPSPTPRAWSNSSLSSQWHHPATSSSVIPFSSCLQSFPIRVFSNESGRQSIGASALASVLSMNIQDWFPFSISPFNEYSGLISFRTDRFDLLAVQGTLKSLLQHHSSRASVLQHSAFFLVQLSHHTWLLEKP